MHSIQATQDIKCNVLNKIEEGRALVEIVNELGINNSTIYRWLNKDEDFRNNYTRARRNQALFYVERIQEVIYYLHNQVDIHGEPIELTRERINAAALEIDTYKWIACKLLPKVFGSATDITNVQINLNQITGMSITNEGKVRDIADKAVKLLADQDK